MRDLGDNSNHVQLDDTDKAIIGHLQDDGRIPYAKLGPVVGLSAAAVRQRVLALIEHGVMQIVAVTDPMMLGFNVQALVGADVVGDLEQAATAISAIEETDYVVITSGRYDVMIEVVCEDNEHLLDLLNRIREIPGVESVEALTYLKLMKQTYDWGTR
ncbi:MAG: Lrp/AsnC family transcriptional regulator [Acidimicrobiia bacterium]|nr:Lrp/AsnC family transcriptional regulator [Acidimicrobiia bacterium]